MGAAVFFTITFVTFVLFHAQGGDAIARSLLPSDTPENVVHSTAGRYGLLQPVPLQYVEWVRDFFSGTMGYSFVSSQPVIAVISSKIPVTLSLMAVSLVLTAVLSTVVGVVAATRRGVVDRILQLAAVVVRAVPGYWLALILVIIFGITLRVVPATGYIPISQSPLGWLSTIILPSIAIAIPSVAFIAIQLRGSLIDVLNQDYIRTLRTRGLPMRSILYKHALRNAAGPALTLLSLEVIGLLGGAIILERIYALPGLGTIALDSGNQGDVPVVVGVVAFMVVVIVVINLAADIVNGLLNPKARVS